MTAIYAQVAPGVTRALVFVLASVLSPWRIFQRNRGDRFVEFAVATTMLLVVVLNSSRLGIPDLVISTGWPLLMLTCTLSIFLMLQQGYCAFLRRNRDRARQTGLSETGISGKELSSKVNKHKR